MLESLRCQNCDHPLLPEARFCSHCGQRANTHRFTNHHLSHEVLHAFTHADATIFSLITQLFRRPGKVLNDYIVLGRRKSYFNPFTFVILLGGVMLLITGIFKPYRTLDETPQLQMARAALQKDPSKHKQLMVLNRSVAAAQFIEKNNKLLLLASIPLTAFVFWLGFRRRGLSYAEHIVAATFLTGALAVFMSLVIIPIMGLAKHTSWYGLFVMGSLVFQLVYFSLAYWQWSRHWEVRSAAWRPWVFSALNIVLWSLVSAGGVLLYIWSGYLFG